MCLQVAYAAHHMLSVIDIGAAQLNDKINLFKDDVKFPEVFRSDQSPVLTLSKQSLLVMPREIAKHTS